MGKVFYFSIIFLLFAALIPLQNPAEAQSPTASISIECQELVQIDVFPGSTAMGYTICTLSNPTAYQEKVDITVNVNNLAYSAPGSVTVGASEEVDFQVTYRAEQNMLVQTITSIIHAQVDEINGVPPPNVAEDESSIMIDIMQYGKCAIQVDDAYVELDVSVEYDVQLKLFNNGNGNDDLRIGLRENSMSTLEEAGFVISFPVSSVNMDPQTSPSIVHFTLKAPYSTSSSAVLEDGFLTDYFTLEVFVVSDYECKNSICVEDSAIITLKIMETPPEEPNDISENNQMTDMNTDETIIYASGAVVLLLVIGILFFRKS